MNEVKSKRGSTQLNVTYVCVCVRERAIGRWKVSEEEKT